MFMCNLLPVDAYCDDGLADEYNRLEKGPNPSWGDVTLLKWGVLNMYREGVEGNIVGLFFCQSIFREALLHFLPFVDVEDDRTYRMHPVGTRAIPAHAAA